MKRQLTPEQQAKSAERKARFRQLWKQVADMPELERIQLSNRLGIVTCEGRPLSIKNQCLLAFQIPGASVVGGFRQWLGQGRAVTKGQHGAMIWVPIGARPSTATGTATGTATDSAPGTEPAAADDVNFIIGTVFDISQTHAIDETAAEPVAEPVAERLELVAA